MVEKISQVEQFWGFRQKKYKKLRSFVFTQNYRFNNRTYKTIANFVNNENFNKYNLYTGVKNNKHKNELIPATLARRLLRTKRTLVLPAHINITLIASSYDVVHSWFVPGLGLKIDCVPGRSNHLTLYIDNVGFYYGQCAEICGRYHHHMPIRVCALNYEHFLLWWQTKGLPRMYRSTQFMKRKSILLNKFKAKLYRWEIINFRKGSILLHN
jgi:heme/copper-type cytochrome/quinol oxidase subunit 2